VARGIAVLVARRNFPKQFPLHHYMMEVDFKAFENQYFEAVDGNEKDARRLKEVFRSVSRDSYQTRADAL